MHIFFNDAATTEIYTLSLHDALPILAVEADADVADAGVGALQPRHQGAAEVTGDPLRLAVGLQDAGLDRKSTRLNSSHANISYAVFCLKKKKSPVAVQRYPATRHGIP